MGTCFKALHLRMYLTPKFFQLEMAMPQLWKFLYVYGTCLKALGLVYRPNLRLTASDCRIFDHPGSLLTFLVKMALPGGGLV